MQDKLKVLYDEADQVVCEMIQAQAKIHVIHQDLQLAREKLASLRRAIGALHETTKDSSRRLRK